MRTKGELEDQKNQNQKVNTTNSSAPIDAAQERARREEVQGIFVVKGDTAEFRPVETGIAGATDIEILNGVEPGEQIVIGSYKAIRTMRTGARVKIDNRNTAVVDSKR